MSFADRAEALRIAYRQTTALADDQAQTNPVGVLGLAMRRYFPNEAYAERIGTILSDASNTLDGDLSLRSLREYISPEDFLEMMRQAFPDYVFAKNPDAVRSRLRPEQWYSALVEAIHKSDGPDGVSQVLRHLMNRLGQDKRDELLTILKAKYPDMPDSLEGIMFSSESGQAPDPEVEKAQLLLAVAGGADIDTVRGISEPVRQAVREALAEAPQAEGVAIPADFAERMEQAEQRRADTVMAKLAESLRGLERRSVVTVDNLTGSLLTDRAFAIVAERLAAQDYSVEKADQGGYSGKSALKISETGDRLAERDRQQAETLVRLVTGAIIAGNFRPDVPDRHSQRAVEMAVAALSAAPELSSYTFKSVSKGGYTGNNVFVIEIGRPQPKAAPQPTGELERLVKSLDEKSVRQLEDAMLERELLFFATRNGQGGMERTVALLDRILEHRALFSRPVFAEYAEQLRNNLTKPPLGMGFASACSRNLPDLFA